jgi:hypothetical protein
MYEMNDNYDFLNGSYLHVCYFCENKSIDINILGWGREGGPEIVYHICVYLFLISSMVVEPKQWKMDFS